MYVNLYATLRHIVVKKTLTVDAPEPASVRNVVERVTIQYPALAPEVWQATGELQDSVHIFLNGRETRWLAQGLDTLLEPGDTLDIFPPVGGGAR